MTAALSLIQLTLYHFHYTRHSTQNYDTTGARENSNV